jgi:hypothetical protein
MISQQIAPLKMTAVDPGAGRDSAGFGIGTDGQTYVIKSPATHPLLPATEAFCEALAVACQLPATTGAWLDVNGLSCYGSRFEGGLDQPLRPGTPLDIESRKRQWTRCTNPGVATATFAFDLFVFNYDRHHNNWTFQNQNGNITARVFDFSRAWWTCASDPARLPAPAAMKGLPTSSERTCRTYKSVRLWAKEDLSAAQNVLDLLTNVPDSWVARQISGLPAGWIDQQTLDATLAWWASPLKNDRIDQIQQGLKNGSLF